MNKNNGFTLVELLAVIVILSILTVIAVPNVNSILKKNKTNMFCKKVESMEAAAKYYAQDNLSDLATEEKTTIASNIPIWTLVEKGYLKKDKDNCTLGTNCVTDPRDGTPLDKYYIEVYSENNRFYGKYLYTQSDADSKVCGDKINYKVNTYGSYTPGSGSGYGTTDNVGVIENNNSYYKIANIISKNVYSCNNKTVSNNLK